MKRNFINVALPFVLFFGMLVAFPYLIRLDALGYKFSPSYWKAEGISKSVAVAYHRYLASGKPASTMTFEELIPYLEFIQKDKAGVIASPEDDQRKSLSCSQAWGNIPVGCLVLKDGAKILYVNQHFDPQSVTIPFYIDTGGESTGPNRTYLYQLFPNGHVVSQKEMDFWMHH